MAEKKTLSMSKATIYAAIIGGIFVLLAAIISRDSEDSQVQNINTQDDSQVFTGDNTTVNNYSHLKENEACLKTKQEITNFLNKLNPLELSFESKQDRYIAHVRDELTKFIKYSCEQLIINDNKIKTTLQNAKNITPRN